MLAVENGIRARASYQDVCYRDRGNATSLPACGAADTALRSCTAGCTATDITATPAGILDSGGTLNMTYAELRLKAYAEAINNNDSLSPPAAAAAADFRRFVGVEGTGNFGRFGATAGTMLATRFAFATPLPGYASSRDRPTEQESKVGCCQTQLAPDQTQLSTGHKHTCHLNTQLSHARTQLSPDQTQLLPVMLTMG